MGSDTGLKGVVATVIELLPNAACRVEVESGAEVIAHVTGPRAANFVRLRVKDRVLLELSPRDKRRGRIVKLLEKG